MAIRPFETTSPKIDRGVFIDDSAVVIGDVTIGADSSIWPLVVIRGDVNQITIGQRSSIQDLSVIHVTHCGGPYHPEGFDTVVGDDVTVGHRVVLHGCHIGDRCLIGMGSSIMDGAVVEPEVILGAGSLVPPGKKLTSGHLWLGSPARCVRELTTEEIEQLSYSAQHYVKLKNRHLD